MEIGGNRLKQEDKTEETKKERKKKVMPIKSHKLKRIEYIGQ